MDAPEYHELVSTVSAAVGEGFRTAFYYDAEDWTALYVRGDISTTELRETIPDLIDRGRDQDPIIPPERYGRLGDSVGTVELYERGLLLHLRLGDRSGIGITIDRGIDVEPSELARNCRAAIDHSVGGEASPTSDVDASNS